jgi:hypothetical protein
MTDANHNWLVAILPRRSCDENEVLFPDFAHMTFLHAEYQPVTYRFTRDANNAAALMSANRPSTDAMGAIANWELAGSGRSYQTLVDKDDEVVVRLSFLTANRDQAASDLDALCSKWGVTRELA